MLLSTKWAVALCCCAALLTARDGFTARLLVGAACNAAGARALKRVLAQPRPAKAKREGAATYGLPSSHAHLLFFLACSLSAALAGRAVTPAPAWATELLPGARGAAAQAALLAGAALLSLWRVVIERHTVPQVAAGVVTGSLGALAWDRLQSLDAALVQRLDAALAELGHTHPWQLLAALLSCCVSGLAALALVSRDIRPAGKRA